MLRKFAFFFALAIFAGIVVYNPLATSDPGANPKDPAREDLSRVEYPSLAGIAWRPHFMMPSETLESLFGEDWPYVARFNRIDRRHVYPGMTIKVPLDMNTCRKYTPMPEEYEPARNHEKYILIDLTEQWMGAYQYGKLVFSVPAATGAAGHETPVGIFQVDARHKNHTSSLYKTEDQTAQYPMDNAIRFHVGADNVSYWIHARDLPGKPASHGCVGLYDEGMQNRVYGIPERPVLLDSERLYAWAVGDDVYEEADSGELELVEDGPMVEVRGANPVYRR
ncbi:L,D-transpeptidase [Geomonas sp. RF6]|uniref:L,D-transpeptidase n=1 Tax=Geomonas sp. RF6 TaxID=2897342 RepID=UPI001E454899|nr:L,D-transpeptidase [Geomonas sp. RF6]UFS69455.1 L,D-transpeptidase [Geomonas sp. RF6]